MKLFELAYACRIYSYMTNFDAGYQTMFDITGGRLDFDDSRHVKALLNWLNSWGCRQFALAYHSLAADSIRDWAHEWEDSLPSVEGDLIDAGAGAIDSIAAAYAELARAMASRRKRKTKEYAVTVGPTGAAKILHAARPSCVPPWDDPIRDAFGLDDSDDSFRRYLRLVQDEVKQVASEARGLGISSDKIGKAIGRPESSLPKLVDEYNWVTITKGVKPLSSDELARWARWSVD